MLFFFFFMCFRLTRPFYCPICRTAFDDVLNIIRCNRLPGVDPLCGDWNLHYANASVPLARPIVDLVDPLAEWPYNDIKFFVRPCVSCAIQICTGMRSTILAVIIF